MRTPELLRMLAEPDGLLGPQELSGSDCFALPDGGAGGQLPSDD